MPDTSQSLLSLNTFKRLIGLERFSDLTKRYFKLDLKINLDDFLGLGFEPVFVAIIGGIVLGFLTAMYPMILGLLPFLPSTNLLLFASFGIPLTASTHFDSRLGFISIAFMMLTARMAQIVFGAAQGSEAFILLVGVWSITVIFLIGYLPGQIIETSENLRMLFKGITKITVLYAVAEILTWTVARNAGVSTNALYLFPLASIPLLLMVSTGTTFIATNTFCPYMMMPLVSRALGKGEQRHCGAGNYVYKYNTPITIGKEEIRKANMKGFKLISQLPTVTVFSCPLGGIVSVYNSGDVLIRKVRKQTADSLNKNIRSIVLKK